MIRLANVEDAESIAKVHVRSWQGAYVGIIPQPYLDSLSVTKRTTSWESALSASCNVTAVFDLPAGIVGFVSVAPSRDSGATKATAEVTAIYVDPPYWRLAIGKRLLEWAAQMASERAWSKMTLWVLRDNRQARSFYENAGWRYDGTERSEHFLESEVVEVRYESNFAV